MATDRRQFLQNTVGAIASATLNPSISLPAQAAEETAALPAAFVALKDAMSGLAHLIYNGDSQHLYFNFLDELRPFNPYPIEKVPDKDVERYWDYHEQAYRARGIAAGKQLRHMLQSNPEAVAKKFASSLRNIYGELGEALLPLQQDVQQAADSLHVDLDELSRRNTAWTAILKERSRLEDNVWESATLSDGQKDAELDRQDRHFAPLIESRRQAIADLFKDLGIPPDEIHLLPFPTVRLSDNFLAACRIPLSPMTEFWAQQAKGCVLKQLPELLVQGGMEWNEANALIARHRSLFEDAIERERQSFLDKHQPKVITGMRPYIENDNDNVRFLKRQAEWADKARDRAISDTRRER